jgi:hypothetical protein
LFLVLLLVEEEEVEDRDGEGGVTPGPAERFEEEFWVVGVLEKCLVSEGVL